MSLSHDLILLACSVSIYTKQMCYFLYNYFLRGRRSFRFLLQDGTGSLLVMIHKDNTKSWDTFSNMCAMLEWMVFPQCKYFQWSSGKTTTPYLKVVDSTEHCWELTLENHTWQNAWIWQDISLKLSSKSIFRKFVHLALGVYYYLKATIIL